MNTSGTIVLFVLFVFGMYVLYWVIRYGVRDGVRDARNEVDSDRQQD